MEVKVKVKVAGETEGSQLREAFVQGVDFEDRFGSRVECWQEQQGGEDVGEAREGGEGQHQAAGEGEGEEV